LHSLQIVEPGPHIGETMCGKLRRLAAPGAIVELEQLRYLVEAEAQALCGFDEAHARHVAGAVAPNFPGRSVRGAKQRFALVEADRLDVDAARLREAADGEIFLHAVILHDRKAVSHPWQTPPAAFMLEPAAQSARPGP